MSNEIEIRVVSKDQTAAGFASADANARKLAKGVDGGPGSAGSSFTSAEKKASSLGATLRRVGEVAAGVLAANVLQAGAQRAKALIDSTVEAASALGESVNAVQKVFDGASASVLRWGQENANAIGLSTRAFNQAATPLGSMLKNQGLTMDEVKDHTIRLTERAADLASVFNTDVMDALTAIQAGLRGEQDPLERYGVSLSAVAVEARALADTHKTSAMQLTAQEKALARLNIIYEQTADSAGDFAGTANGLANSQRIATATIEDAKAKIGVAFIPVMAKAAQLSGEFAAQATKLPAPVLLVTAAVVGLAAGLLLLAPRIIATKTALAEMAASGNIATRSLAGATVAIGKTGAALGVLSIVGGLVGSVFQHSLNPQIDDLTLTLNDWAASGKTAGEAMRIIGDGASDLDRILAAANTGWVSYTDKASDAALGLLQLNSPLDDSREKLTALDTALAQLASNGRGVEAVAIFGRIQERAASLNISVDDLKAAFPQYTAAIDAAAHGTKDLGKAATGTAQSVDDLSKSFDDLFQKTFGLEEAQDRAADAVQRLREQIKQQRDDNDKGAGSLTGNTQAARDNRDAVRNLVQQYEDLAVKMQESGKNTAGLKKQLEDQLVAMGFSRKEAQRYTAQLGDMTKALDAIPDVIPVKISVAEDWTKVRKQDRAGIPPIVYGPDVHNVQNQTGYTGHAAGGPSGAGMLGSGWSWVGERGAEVVKLPFGSTVYPHGQSMQMAAQGGGGELRHLIVDVRINGRQQRQELIDDAISRGVAQATIAAAYP